MSNNCSNRTIIIIDNYYFDVTEYMHLHPGGSRILSKYHLKDATKEFNSVKGHNDEFTLNLLDKFCIGHKDDVDINRYEK